MIRTLLILTLCFGCAYEGFDEIIGDRQVDLSVQQTLDSGGPASDLSLTTDGALNDSGLDQNVNADSDAERQRDTGVPVDDGVSPPSDAALLGDAGRTPSDMSVQAPDAMVIEPDMMIPEPPVGYTLCGIGMTARVGRGTWAEPIRIGRFPFLDRFTTVSEGESRIDTYDCAETTGEFGREVVYEFELESPGDLTAVVRDNGIETDIDLHLLRDHSENGRTVEGCVGRAHTRLVAERLEPGRYLLVADSWSDDQGASYEGAYDLAIDVVEHRVWRDVPLTENVLWSRYRGTVDGSWQSINVLTVLPTAIEGMELGAHAGCDTVVSVLGGRDAIAGVNAGYFSDDCSDKGFVRADDSTLSLSLATTSDPPLLTEARVGWRGQNVWFEWGESGSDWTEPAYGLGAHPMLVQDGVANAQVQNGEQVYSATDWAPQPRTAFAYTQQGDVLLLTVDGRTSAGAGLSTPALATWLGNQFDVSGAINLDGGGSTTFAVNSCWVGPTYGAWGARAFNSPSDNQNSDENGARGVSSGIYVY